MVEGSVVFDPVDRALPLLDEFGGLDLRADGELPVRAGLALGDDVGRLRPLGDDLAADLQPRLAGFMPLPSANAALSCAASAAPTPRAYRKLRLTAVCNWDSFRSVPPGKMSSGRAHVSCYGIV